MSFAVLVTSLSVFVEFVGSVVLLVAVACVFFVVGEWARQAALCCGLLGCGGFFEILNGFGGDRHEVVLL